MTPSTFESIDYAIFEWLNKEVNLHTTTNKGWEKTPITWTTPERAFHAKNKKELRDDSGTLILPTVTITRSSTEKNPSSKGAFWANIPPVNDERGGSIPWVQTIQQEKTSNFANADALRKRNQINFPRKNKKIVYKTITIPMPAYIDIIYSIELISEYQQQMNEMLTPFITKTGGINYFTMRRDEHIYPGFIQSNFSYNNNIASIGEEQRLYKTKVDIKVLGYLIGEGNNQSKPKVIIRENVVDVKIPRERAIWGDIPEHGDSHKTSYRE